MQVIKLRGLPHPNAEEAIDSLAGVKVVNGFIAGFVDKENRVISFHQDFHPHGDLVRGQERVEFVIADESKQPFLSF